MEPEGSIPCSQQPATGSYHEQKGITMVVVCSECWMKHSYGSVTHRFKLAFAQHWLC